MENFTFQAPTNIVFGRDTENQVGELTRAVGKKVLLHYGGGSIKKSGLYDRVKKSLAEAGVEVVELGGVQPNPLLSLVRRGIEICQEEKVEMILAVGGGSVIDSAKGIAVGYYDPENFWQRYYIEPGTPPKALPIGTVLTIPAAGSEVSPDTVVSDAENERKIFTSSPVLYPKFSILNPVLTMTLPDYQTACGIADMMAHILERYFSPTEHCDFINHLAEGALRSIMKNGRLVLADPKNYDLRAELLLAGSFAHNNMLGVGRAHDWMTHMMEHEVSAIWETVTHGEGLAALFPAWIRHVYKHNVPRFVRFAEEVFGYPRRQ